MEIPSLRIPPTFVHAARIVFAKYSAPLSLIVIASVFFASAASSNVFAALIHRRCALASV